MLNIDEKLLDTIAEALLDPGYILLEQVIPQQLLTELLLYVDHLQDSEFRQAGVGRQASFQLQDTVRSDRIYWLNNDHSGSSVSQFLSWMEYLRIGMNRRLFMGLFDYESHFARYEAGAFYKKHRDTFREDTKKIRQSTAQAKRVLSTVLYLNENWDANDGGELVIYSEDDSHILEKISPECGRLIIFLSEKFPHEVLPATRERKSIAGWFRVNNE